MTNTYKDLVLQTFNFPQEGYDLKDDYLQYNGVDVKALIDKYGTPLKFSFLPKIGMQIERAKYILKLLMLMILISLTNYLKVRRSIKIFLSSVTALSKSLT